MNASTGPAAAAPEPLTLLLARQPALRGADGREHPLSALDAALLSLLAIDGPQPRVRLIEWLWPEVDLELARGRLRQHLFALRRQFGRPLAEGHAALALAPGIAHDLADAATLLGALRYPAQPEFDRWLQAARQQRFVRERDALARRIDDATRQGDLDAARSDAEALLLLDPLSEEAHRRLMTLHYLRGDRAAALRAFDHCERLLKDEVGTRPSAPTLALLQTLERERTAPAPAAAAAPLPASLLRPPRMVGRADALRQLAQAWAAQQVAVVVAEAGLGKSRLLQEFAADHAAVLRCAAQPGDAQTPFATLARLRQALGDDDDHAAAPTPGHLAERLRAAGLTGLVIDDLQFADAASLAWLQARLCDGTGGAPRWLLACRPAAPGSALQGLLEAVGDAARLHLPELAPLDEAALAELLDALALPGLSGPALAPSLHAATGGNPRFVLETLKQAWREQVDGGPALGRHWPTPPAIRPLIAQRLGRLPPAAMALARVAAIAAADFDLPLAGAVLGQDALQLADAWQALEAAQVLCGTRFAHTLMRDAVLRSVPPAIAQHLHERVAQWLGAQGGEPARVARHWIAADRPAKALPWLDAAARRAEAARRGAERLELLEMKSTIEADTGATADAFETALQVAAVQLDVDADRARGLARCDRLDRLADTPARQLRADLARARLAIRRGDLAQAQALATAALHAALALGDADGIGDSRLALFECLGRGDHPDAALRAARACADWVAAQADGARRVAFHAALGALYDNTGRPGKALPQHARAFALARDRGDTQAQAIVAGQLGRHRMHGGGVQPAVQRLREALRLAALQPGPEADKLPALLDLAECLTLAGRHAEALHHLDAADEIAAHFAPAFSALAAACRATCWWHLGQRGRTLQALALLDAQPEAPLPARVRGHQLRAWLAQSTGGDGQAALDAALELLEGELRPDLRELVAIARAHRLPPLQALDELEAVCRRARLREFGGHELEARLHCTWIACAVDADLARAQACEALRLATLHDLVISPPSALWLRCAEAALAAGDTALAHPLLARGRAWVCETARDHVPAPFRNGFLRGHPVNAALLALAGTERAAAAAPAQPRQAGALLVTTRTSLWLTNSWMPIAPSSRP